MIRVLIADDHAIVRRGLREIVSGTSDIVVIGEASNGQEAVEKVSSQQFDVVLLDISMPVKGGVAALKEIRDLRPRLPVLLLSIHPEDQYAMRVLRAGASGYLTKESAPEELIKAIRKVHSGGKYVSSTLAEKLAELLTSDPSGRLHERLSDREFEVLRMLASGISVSRIADDLNLSVKTVSTYRSRLMQKMQCENNAELIRYAIANNLI
jgi:two-component system, NarL family, invasion response regulator UvrY